VSQSLEQQNQHNQQNQQKETQSSQYVERQRRISMKPNLVFVFGVATAEIISTSPSPAGNRIGGVFATS
jgi:hypothetical protein